MDKKPYILSIDGRAAAGKTTLAEELARIFDAPVIHIDDFFLPLELRTDERLRQPGGNVHYERFKSEVVDMLCLGRDFSYRRFDCKTKSLAEMISIPYAPVYIVEGSYSHHPCFGDYADLRIFKDIDKETQWERILKRNGLPWADEFRYKWIPMEEEYFSFFGIREKADLVL